jgi:hypothetical protein
MQENNLFLYVVMILLAIFGSCVRWLNVVSVVSRTYRMLLINSVTAVFIGLLACNLHRWLQYHDGLAHIISSLAGYYGTASIDLMSRAIAKYFKLEGVIADKTVDLSSEESMVYDSYMITKTTIQREEREEMEPINQE